MMMQRAPAPQRRMRRLLTLLVTIGLANSAWPFVALAQPDDDSAEVQRIIVEFRTPPGLLDGSGAAHAARNDERSKFERDFARLDGKAKPPARQDLRRAFNGIAIEASPPVIDALRKLPYVKRVHPDVAVKTSLAQSVPLIGASQVWTRFGVTGAGVKVAIVDTGIDWTHPDLGGCLGAGCKVIGGFDYVNGDFDPRDDHGHGTHVAGIVAANGVVKGVAPDARLLAFKVMNANGDGYASTIIAGMEGAVDPDGNPATNDGAHVINLSLGGGGDPDDPMSQAVDTIAARGVVVVAAAGNYGPSPGSVQSPGTARHALTVGATDKLDQPASFSSRGPVTWDEGSILKPDLAAPGVNICSTRWGTSWTGSECRDAVHVSLSGTSMAAPHVAGVVALLLQKHPGWTPAEVKLALRATAVRLPQPSSVVGYGRLSALNALTLDHAPPIASLVTSGSGTADLDIVGTATGEHFARYELSIGAGLDPDAWTPIASSTSAVTDGVLASNVDALARPDGPYTLRLVVVDTEGFASEDRTFLHVDNARIVAPRGTDSFALGATIRIRGSVAGGTQFERYVIQHGAGFSPSVWRTTGITLANGGTQPVTDGILGTWDTTALSGPGVYTLRVVVSSAWGNAVETVNAIYLDPLLKAGWPVRLPYDFVSSGSSTQLRTSAEFYTFPSRANATDATAGGTHPSMTVATSSPEFAGLADGYYYWAGMLAPVVSDLDRDGRAEIVVARAGTTADLRVYADDGTLKWSAGLAADVAGGNFGTPAIADLDGDGSREVVACAPRFSLRDSHLFAFRSDGTRVPGFPVTLPIMYNASVAIADLDGDGFREIIVQSHDGSPRYLTVVGHSGSIVSRWELPPVHWSASIQPTPAVGNFDDDPQLEIVVAEPSEFAGYDHDAEKWNDTGIVHVYNLGGAEVSGWPKYTQGITFSSPSVADIDGDGREDIIVGHMYAGNDVSSLGGLHVFDRNGNPVPGWPRLIGEQFWSTPAVGDLDGDGSLEIAIGDLSRRVWVFRKTGETVAGWPRAIAWANYHSTAIADVDGDQSPDVLATAANGYMGGGVYAWSRSGSALPGFPLYTDVDAQAGPTVADVDGDGKVEVVASSDWDHDQTTGQDKFRGSVFVWDLAGAHRALSAPWPHFHRDSAHAGRYVGSCISIAVTPAAHYASKLPATRAYNVGLTSRAASGCPTKAWALTANVPSSWSATLSQSNPTVPAGGTVSLTLSVTAPAGTPQGTYDLAVRAAGDARNPPTQSTAKWVVDLTAPTISITTPTEGARYKQGSSVLASYRCNDAFGSLVSCKGTVASGSPIATGTVGTKAFVVTATDQAANVTSRTVKYSVYAASTSYRLSVSALAFGDQPLYRTSAAKPVRLVNEGTAILPLSALYIDGADATHFARSSNCGTSVPVGGTCTIQVTFKPRTVGAKTARLVVTAGGGAGTKTVTLSGTGVRAAYAVSPLSLSFGTVAVGTTSPAKTVNVSNTGTVVVPALAFTLSGTNAGQFVRTTNCTAELAVGASCTVSVRFKPTTKGPKSANLAVTAGGGATAKTVSLAGSGG